MALSWKKCIKWTLILTGILIAIVLVIGIAAVLYFQPKASKILNYIQQHPDKAAILLVRNDSVLAHLNTNKLMPLASTMKIIIAIEYARQCAAGIIHPDDLVPLSEVNMFYVPRTDGGAHPTWLKEISNQAVDGQVTIRSIAKGMIKQSSNANTEWLLERLGITQVNNLLDTLGLSQHTPIHYLVSSLFVGKELFPNLRGKALEDSLSQLDPSAYIDATHIIHQKLKTDTTYKNDIGSLSLGVQKIWSDRLPASTVADYVSLMKKINSKTYFDTQTQSYLDEVLEFVMENPVNRNQLQHCGMKGGSTPFVLTKALYATDINGNMTELAYFLNNLSVLDMTRLQMSMNEFERNILSSHSFRNQIIQALWQ